MGQSEFSKDDFIRMLEAWGRWAGGYGGNLAGSTHYQKVSHFAKAFTEDELKGVEHAMLELKRLNPAWYDILFFRYIGGEQLSILRIEIKFDLSTRKAREICAAAETSVWALYYSQKKVA